MTRRLAPLVLLSLIAAAPATTRPGTTGPTTGPTGPAVIDPTLADPPFQGWGVSLCWWAHVAGGYPEPVRSRIMDQVFDARAGLGLNIVRYNIGGGENGTDHFLQSRAAVPGYEPSPGRWDWSADAEQRWVLHAAIARGVDHVQAFSNSPPFWMTRSGSVSGGVDGGENLRPEQFDAFADYLATVVQHFHDSWGVTFETVDPVNEPMGRWWKHGNWQEGCRFERLAQDRIIRLLGQRLRDRHLATTIAASDENTVDEAVDTWLSLSDPARAFVSQVTTHTYGGTRRAGLCEVARAAGRNLWMSETGDADPSGLKMASRIVADLRGLHPSAWVAWQVADTAGGWGFFRGHLNDPRDTAWATNEKFYVMRNFTGHIRPGSRLVAVDDRRAIAAVDGRSVTVVVVNPDEGAVTRTYDLSRFTTVGSTARTWRTSATENLVELPAVAVRGGRLVVTLPPRSVTTLVVAGTTYAGPSSAIDPGVAYDLRDGAGRWLSVDGRTAGGRVTASAERRGTWGLLPTGGGRYAIYSRDSGLVLDVSGGNAIAGAKVIVWADHNADGQRWELVPAGNGAVRLRSALSGGLVLDGSSADGAIEAADDGRVAQQWHLTVRR